MRVTKTIPQKPNAMPAVSLLIEGEPRYACMNGLDSFGRVTEGDFAASRGSGIGGCVSAFAY